MLSNCMRVGIIQTDAKWYVEMANTQIFTKTQAIRKSSFKELADASVSQLLKSNVL